MDYRNLFWQVRDEVPGVPAATLFFNYAAAVREFCMRSLAWQHSIPDALSWDQADSFPDFSSEIPEGTYVVQPVKVKWHTGEEIKFKTRDQLDKIEGQWELTTGPRPHYWTIMGPGDYRMYPLLEASVDEAVLLRVALAPEVTVSDPATSIPDALANEWQHVWAHGALAKLMKIPGKDWTNTELAGSYMSMFEDGIVQAKSRAAADYGRPDRQVAYGGLGMGSAVQRSSNDYR